MVGIHPGAVVGEHFLHADIRVIDGVLAHRRGRDASEKCTKNGGKIDESCKDQDVDYLHIFAYPCLTARTLEYTISLLLFFSREGFAVTQFEITAMKEIS